MKIVFISCLFPFMCFGQSTFSNYFPGTVLLNHELMLEKEAGRSVHLFIHEQYLPVPPAAYEHFQLATIFTHQPDSIIILAGIEESDPAYGSLLLAGWKNGKSYEVVVSYHKASGKPIEHVWLDDPTENSPYKKNCLIYLESTGNFYIEYQSGEHAQPIKNYYSFMDETGTFDLSE